MTSTIPDIITQFTPEPSIYEHHIEDPVRFANVGTNRIIRHSDEPVYQNTSQYSNKRTFEPIFIRKTNGPLIIHDKRWYFRLVSAKDGNYKRARALMDDFDLNQIAKHMVICFTPNTIPGRTTPFRNKDGAPVRIYAVFDSYIEFFEYMQKFPPTERAFYEIIFGELPQKPHFDIDIDVSEFRTLYPEDDIALSAEFLREAVIGGCIGVFSDNKVTLNIERDILLYSSHGDNKYSYHLVLNNKCHDGNREAKAFYDAVMVKVHVLTGGKYLNFVDKSVYSPRQQFRLVGCEKHGSNRPKIFYEFFWYNGNQYTHIYSDDTTDLMIKKLTIIYESMVGFTSGCSFIPSLIPPKPLNHISLGSFPDMELNVAESCLAMLRGKMADCPFSILEIKGHLILLKRHAPSHCPICNKGVPHQKENPYLFILSGKVYWDCRRAPDNAKRLFVGYLAMTVEEIQSNNILPSILLEDVPEEIENGEFMFGDYNIGAPTLSRLVKSNPVSDIPTSPPSSISRTTISISINGAIPQSDSTVNNGSEGLIRPIICVPPEHRRQNIANDIMKMSKAWAEQKYLHNQAEDLMRVRSLESVKREIKWTPGMK